MVSIDDYLFFVDQELDGMIGMVSALGDDLATHRLQVEGGNSPYAILNHCLGVMEFWAGHIVAGRPIHRDRAAEFTASGSVTELVDRVRRARARLLQDVASLQPDSAPRGTPRPGDAERPLARTQGGALAHIHEELARHRGQMEVTRDILLTSWARADG